MDELAMMLDRHNDHLDQHGAADQETSAIDWTQFDASVVDDRTPAFDDISRAVDDPKASADASLLSIDDPLDPGRERTEVTDLHPDRLHRADPIEDAELRRCWAADPRPESWVRAVNPGFLTDVVENRSGRTENCADCSRAFQETLEGRPRVAAEIADRGLGIVENPDVGGEHTSYTEQWAGRRGTLSNYDEIAHRLSTDRGSAIIHADGPEGGHAFNAWWDDGADRVRWADAQIGQVGDWPPADLVKRFPDPTSLYFSRGDHP